MGWKVQGSVFRNIRKSFLYKEVFLFRKYVKFFKNRARKFLLGKYKNSFLLGEYKKSFLWENARIFLIFELVSSILGNIRNFFWICFLSFFLFGMGSTLSSPIRYYLSRLWKHIKSSRWPVKRLDNQIKTWKKDGTVCRKGQHTCIISMVCTQQIYLKRYY